LEEEERWFKTLEERERILEDLEFGENDADKVETIIVVSSFPKLAENISIEEVAKFYNCKECLALGYVRCLIRFMKPHKRFLKNSGRRSCIISFPVVKGCL